MLAHVRRTGIIELIRQNGSLTVADVASRLGVSEMTIRRDITDLERDGHLIRTHGGAVAPPMPAVAQGVIIDRVEPSFAVRLGRQRAAKDRIAAFAATLIGDARTVALDVGVTTHLLAQQLAGRADLSLFTTSLRLATALADQAPTLHLPGGRVSGTDLAVGGASALAAFEALWFDVAFIGVSGITAEGLFDYSQDDTAMKRIYLKRSARKIVLCDSAKFRRMALVRVSAWNSIDILVTDTAPPPEIGEALRRAGTDVKIAGETR